MITFVDLTFSPKGMAASAVVARLQKIPGVTSVMGEHDVMFHWRTNQEFDHHLQLVHKALEGTEATYRVSTVEDSYQSLDPVPWIGPMDSAPPHHPAVQGPP